MIMTKKRMKRILVMGLICAWLELLTVSRLGAGTAGAQTVTPDLLITEIVPASAEQGQPYEFVEIYNNTTHPIDLDGYELQYYTNVNASTPANRWPIASKTIRPKSALVLWLKKFDYPNVPLWDFNANYGTLLSPDRVFEVRLTTSAQGLHDSALRKVAVAAPDGTVVSSALINDGAQDGIVNKSVIYRYSGSGAAMAKMRNGETPTPGAVLPEQVPGPLPPYGLAAQPDNGAVHLAWNAGDPSVSTYRVYHSGADQPLTVTEATYAYIDGLTNGIGYAFWVTAVDENGDESPASEVVGAMPQEVPDTVPPAAPSGLQAAGKTGRVELRWQAVAEPDLAGYRIYVNGALCCTASASETAAVIMPLTSGKQYTFEVTAVDQAGNESARSAPATAGPAAGGMPELIITELVPDTDNYAGYDAFEFIELYNTTGAELDLMGYRVRSGSWEKTIDRSVRVGPWQTAVLWTRRAEISPITLEGFNSYYYYTYQSKYVSEDRLYIVEDVGGLVNSGNQTVSLFDPCGFEIARATYDAADVAAGRSILYGPPADGSILMNKIGGNQKPTPGAVVPTQVPPRPQLDTEAPATPVGVQAAAGGGFVTVTWTANTEPDLFGYNLYKNGEFEHFIPASQQQFTVYGLTGNTAYAFELSAVDTSGNESPRSPAVTAMPSHQPVTQQERTVHPRSPAYQTLWDISDDGPVIPGLAEGLVPQGLAYLEDENWLVTVNYMDDGRPGVVSAVDAATGELVKSLVLYEETGAPYTGHAGGIAISDRHVWIASETYLYRILLEDFLAAQDGEEIRFASRIPVPVEAAFATFSEGVLWVGEFYEAGSYPTDPSHHLTNRDGSTYYAWMAGYELDAATDTVSPESWDGDPNDPAIPDYILSIPEKIQGAVVREDAIILSSSYGRGNNSLLYRYENPTVGPPHASVTVGGRNLPVWFLDSQAEKPSNSRLTVIPMSEGIADVGDVLYVLFESGANKYRYTTAYIMDRMLMIDLDLWDQYGTVYIGGLPETMRPGATAQAKVLKARGKSQPEDLTALYQFASSKPIVARVTPDGLVKARAPGQAKITATNGTETLSFWLTVKPPGPPEPPKPPKPPKPEK